MKSYLYCEGSGSGQPGKTQTIYGWTTIIIDFYIKRTKHGQIIVEDESDDDEQVVKKPSVISRALEMKKLMTKNGWSQSQVAVQYRISRARVSQMLKILKLDQSEIDKIREGGRLTERKVREIRV